MATVIKPKSAKDKLLDNFRTMLEKSSKGKTKKQLEESEKKFNAALDRAVAARKSRRETA